MAESVTKELYGELTVQMDELDEACQWYVMEDRCSEEVKRARYYWRALAKKRLMMGRLSMGVPKHVAMSDAMVDE